MNEKIRLRILTPEEIEYYKQKQLEYQKSRTLRDKFLGRWWYCKTMCQKARYHIRDWWRGFLRDLITVITYQPDRGDDKK